MWRLLFASALLGLVLAPACKPSGPTQDAPVTVASVPSTPPLPSAAPSVSVSPAPAPSDSVAKELGSIRPRGLSVDGPQDVLQTPQGPQGDVMVAPATVTGGTVTDVDRVLASLRARFRLCYRKGLEQHAAETGVLTFTVTLTENGEVASATNTGTGIDGETSACMVSQLKRMQFAAPNAKGVTFTFKATLKPQVP